MSAAPRAAPTPTCCTAAARSSRDIARKRLQAIFNASELGAGFQIALSDLEIRGAGNILGAEQHGHMAAVGFDLYTRMLAEAVEVEKAALEGRPARTARTQAKVDLPVDAYLPDDYVPEEPQKLELYRRLGRVVTDAGLGDMRRELLDRFGPLPAPVERLLEVSQLRYRAEEAGLTSVGDGGGPAGAALRSGLVTRGHDARAGAARRGRPAAGAGRTAPLRLQPGARPATVRRHGNVAADAVLVERLAEAGRDATRAS